LSTSGVETEFYNTLLKIGWENEKEDLQLLHDHKKPRRYW